MPTREELYAENQALKAEVAAMRAQVDWMKRQMFGPGKSEKLDRLQATLPLGETPKVEPPAKTETVPGGAGNVIMNLASLGAQVSCLGVVGQLMEQVQQIVGDGVIRSLSRGF